MDDAGGRVAAIRELLERTERAHGAYEATELNGVYDDEWPRWYAAHAVEQGINELLSRPVDSDELAAILLSTWDELERADPKPPDSWETLTARRLAER